MELACGMVTVASLNHPAPPEKEIVTEFKVPISFGVNVISAVSAFPLTFRLDGTRDIKASVLHLLQLHSPHAVQVIICINLNLLYLLNCRTLVFQFLIDGLRDFIADIRNGRPDFSQVRRKLTVINLRPQLLSQMGFP